MATNVTFNGNTYSIPAEGESSWPELSEFLIDVAGNTQSLSNNRVKIRTATSTPVSILNTDSAVITNLTVAGAVAVSLPAGVVNRSFFIADRKGDAGTNNITITPNGVETIEGAASYVISWNYGAIQLVFDGGRWIILNVYNNTAATTSSVQTFSNKKLVDNSVTFVDNGDNTKQLAFECSGITTATTRTVTVPDVSGTMALIAATQALSNKTLEDSTVTFVDNADTSKKLAFECSGITTATTRTVTIPDVSGTMTLNAATQTLTSKTFDSTSTMTGVRIASLTPNGSDTLTMPTATDTLVGKATTDTLTNKKLSDSTVTFVDNGDVTKQLAFECSGITTSTTRTVTVPDASGTMVLNSATQALTNKDYDGGTASNTSRVTLPKDSTANLAGLTRKQGTIVYDTSLNKIKYDDGSNLNLISSGSSGGAINYISNGDFEDGSVTGWTTYADAAGSTPVDGTGGSPTVTFASSSSSPLRGTYSGLFTKDAANRQGEGVAYAFTLATADLGKTLQITFDSTIASGTFASGDVTIYVYDVTNSSLITPSAINLPTGTNSQYSLAFNATTGTSYRLIFHVASTSSSAYTIKLDNVSLSPVVRPVVAGISDWQSYTPTWSTSGSAPSLGNGTLTGRWRRVGDSKEYMISLLSGTTTTYGTGSFLFSLASGDTIDTTKIVSTTAGRGALGVSTAEDYGANYHMGAVTYYSTTQITALTENASSNWSGTSPFTPTASEANNLWTFTFKVPIVNFSSNITIASTTPAIEYVGNSSSTDADDTSSFTYGSAGNVGILRTTSISSTRKKRVRFTSPIQTTDRIVLEWYDPTAGVWMPNAAIYQNSTQFACLNMSSLVTSTTYGVGAGITSVSGSNTDLDVCFGRYAVLDEAGGIANWNTGSILSGSKWRVAKYSAIGAAELAPATSTSSGTVSGGTVPGKTSGVAIVSGYLGEEIMSTGTSLPVGSTGSAANATSITLTAGCWDISLYGRVTAATSGVSGVLIAINTTSASTAGTTGGLTRIDNDALADNKSSSFSIPGYRVNISSSTTYYFISLISYTGTTPTLAGTIRGVRVG